VCAIARVSSVKRKCTGLVKQCNVIPGAININTRTGYTAVILYSTYTTVALKV